jgi:TonB family protein
MVTLDHWEKIMRHNLVASLLLSPMLLTASAVASQPKTDAPANSQALRVSSGEVAPASVDTANLHISADVFNGAIPSDAKVVLSLYVDNQGQAHGIRIVKPVNPELDARVISAVRHLHFTPATRNDQAIPVAMNLTVDVKR